MGGVGWRGDMKRARVGVRGKELFHYLTFWLHINSVCIVDGTHP